MERDLTDGNIGHEMSDTAFEFSSCVDRRVYPAVRSDVLERRVAKEAFVVALFKVGFHMPWGWGIEGDAVRLRIPDVRATNRTRVCRDPKH